MSSANVFSKILRYPWTWVAIAMLVIMEGAFLTRFGSFLPSAIGALVVGLALLAMWPALLLRTDAFLQRLYELPDSVRNDRLKKIEALAQELKSAGSEQGVHQLNMLQQKLDSLADVLRQRLDSGELTFGRYLRTAEQVFLSAIDNLHDIAVSRTSIGGINRDYIEERLRGLGGEGSDDERRQGDTLRERLGLLERQEKRIAELFASNEAAMTALDNTAAALADTRMGRRHASMDADAAMSELEQLASRVRHYAAPEGQ